MNRTPDQAEVDAYHRSLALLQDTMQDYLKRYAAANSFPCREDVVDNMFISLISGTDQPVESRELGRQYVDILFANETIENSFKMAIAMKVMLLSASGMGSEAMLIVKNLLKYGIRALQLNSKVPETLSEFSAVISNAASQINSLSPPKAIYKDIQPYLANGRYAILEHLGKGGYGVVHKARDTKLNRHIAVKHLSHKTGLPHEKRLIRDLAREAMSLAGFSHPNIVQVYDFLEDDGGCYILMEYAEKGTLHGLLDRNDGKLPGTPIEQYRFYQCLFEGLDCAHGKSVVHRDIKPSNILLFPGRELMPKYADFGISSCIGTSVSSVGTPLYMAPELRSTLQHTASAVVDVYSLGKMIHECMTGEVGWVVSGDHESLSLAMSRVLQTACSQNPEMRYKSIEEMREAFNTAWEDELCP